MEKDVNQKGEIKNHLNNEDRYKQLLRNLNCIIYQIDPKATIPPNIDGTIFQMTGYLPEEFSSGRISWFEIVYKNDLEIVNQETQKILNIENYVADKEYRIIHKSGEIKWVRDIAKKVVDDTSLNGTIQGILYDITNTKKTEQELRESEERYKAFFNNNYVIMLIIDPDTSIILDANPAACKFYGWARSEIIQMHIGEINTLTPEEVFNELENARMQKRNHFFFKHRLKNGSIRDVEVFSGPIIINGKQVLYSVITDITENKRMEETLRQMQFSIEKARDSIFWVGEDAKIIYANESACTYLEYSKEELLGLTIFNIDPHFKKELWQNHWNKTRELKSYKIETQHRTKSGRIFPVEISIDFFTFEGKEYHAAFARDITSRKQAEEALEKYKNLLSESQSVAHIGSWEMDLPAKKLFWSDETFRIFGVDNLLFEPTVESFLELLIKEDRNITIEHLNFALETKYFKDLKYRIVKPSGAISWVHNTGQIFCDKNGIPVKIIGTVQDITERVIIEQELRNSEDKFSKAFHTSPDSININSLIGGVYIDVNEGFTKLTGYTKEDVIGKSSLDVDIWENPGDRTNLVKGLKEKGEVNNLEAGFRLKNGVVKTGLMSARIIEIGGEKCILSITRDISERKIAEEALRESEERFHLMFKNNGAVMLLIEPDTGKIIDANDAASFFYGYTHDILCSMSIDDINILTREIVTKEREPAQKDKRNYFTLKHRLANGETRTVEMYSSPLTVNGKTFIFSIIHDITERETAENELRLRSAALEAAANAIVITDNSGKILWTNKAFTKLTGYQFEEIAGKNPRILKSGNHGSEYYKKLWETITSGKVWVEEIINKRKDGTLYTENQTIAPVRDKAGKISHFISIKQDISQRKKSEEELLIAKEKAEISEKLKSAFLAQMSHEIRSPLYRILGYVSLIKDFVATGNLEDIREVKEYFNSIDLSSQRLTRTIDSILNMSELQTQSYTPSFVLLNLLDILKRLHLEYLLQANQKNLDFKISCQISNPNIRGDEYSVTQIFANLIDNALKYSEKGEVKVVVERDKEKQLTVEVQDTGIGISKEFLKILFSPFTQEETGYTRQFDGNGLGLALVKSYCDLNNATVDVKSKKGKGTTFKVTFKDSA